MDRMADELRRQIRQMQQAVDVGPGRRAYMPMEGVDGSEWLPYGAAAARAEATHLQQVVNDLESMA